MTCHYISKHKDGVDVNITLECNVQWLEMTIYLFIINIL